MKSQNTILFALAAGVLALAGCGSTGSTVDTTNQAYGASAEKQQIRFPDAGSAWLKGGTFIDVEQLRRIGRGMTKNQVRELISYPHFGEGLFGPKEWDYLFNFRTGKGDEFVTCQYKVVFKDGVSDAMYWKEPACASYLKPKVAEVVRPAPVPAAAPAQKVTLGADGLFRFDGGALGDLLPEGRAKIERLAADIKRNFKQLQGIVVTGHTDRLGSDSYNDALSLARANTVRELLVRQGLDARLIRAAGEGKRRPVVDCAGNRPTATLVSCLQPNRRVELDVSAEQ
jgi:outer membrane protein OmpA-like peptidoglycan-associated protein